MIPHPFRHKGGAPQIGALRPGDVGPFGICPDLDEDDEQQPPATNFLRSQENPTKEHP